MRPSEAPSSVLDASFSFDRLPPHDLAAEACVLSAIVLDASVRAEVCNALRSDDFFQADNGIVFGLIHARERAGKPVDWELIRSDLTDRGMLEEVGGLPYLAELVQAAPSAAHGVHYAVEVIKCSRRRAGITACNNAIRRFYAPGARDGWEAEVRELADDAMSILNHGTTETIRHVRDVIADAMKRRNDGTAKRLATGLKELDEMIGGFALGRMTVIGGRPGMGKSQIAKQIALNVAAAGTPVGIVSIEEDCQKIGGNLLSNRSGITNSQIAYERCDEIEWGEVEKAAALLGELPLYVDDQQTALAGVVGAISRMATKYGCKMVVVDYLQLIAPDNDRAGNREQEVRKLSNELKAAFKRLNIAGVVTAQLNRGAGTDRPQIHNIRESGAIDQDGDCVLLLHREDYYRMKDPNFVPDFILEIDVAKNKDGAQGKVPVTFDGSTQSIRDRADPLALERPRLVQTVDDFGF